MTEENIERSANLISSKSLDEKRAGLRSLARMKSPEAMQILGEVVESREPPIADEALTLLANISGEDATPVPWEPVCSPLTHSGEAGCFMPWANGKSRRP